MSDREPVRILVVEDDAGFRHVLQKRLEREGFGVAVAADGREGMRAIVTHEPDIVLSDWMMPHVDGLELCQSIKTGLGDAAPYFVLLTARGEISDQLLALDTGADDYLVKPCDMGELMARVRAGLRNLRLTRELRRASSALHLAEHELSSARAELARGEALLRCPGCQGVSDAEGRWESLDAYVERAGLLRFAEHRCPACTAKPTNGHHAPASEASSPRAVD